MKKYFLQKIGEEPLEITSFGTFSVGREGRVSVDDPYMSRINFLISLPATEKEFAILIDGNGISPSRNGTVINGIQLSLSSDNNFDEAAILEHNDLIVAGNTTFRFLVFNAERRSFLAHKETLSS